MFQSKKRSEQITSPKMQFIGIFLAPDPVRTATNTLSDGRILEIFQSDDFFGPIR